MSQSSYILSQEQTLFLQLILGSNLSWDQRSIDLIREWCGAQSFISMDSRIEDIAKSSYSLCCIGCNTVHEPIGQYPMNLEQCPNCAAHFSKPLLYKSAYLYAGEAKRRYIRDALFWPSPHTMDLHINLLIHRRKNHADR